MAAGMALVLIGALWTHTRPSASMSAAYDADPALAALRLDFTDALDEALATVIVGTLARTAT
jgi:hypothetical protein